MPSADHSAKIIAIKHEHSALRQFVGFLQKNVWVKVAVGAVTTTFLAGVATGAYRSNHPTKNELREAIKTSEDKHLELGHAEVKKRVEDLVGDVALLKGRVEATHIVIDDMRDRQILMDRKIDRILERRK